MADLIEQVLSQIDAWYNELPGGNERPKLLSKLATLELCGWLEERFDGLASQIAGTAGVANITAVIEKIERTYGFHYRNHVRGILVTIGGELLLQRAEAEFERKYPGELERLQSSLAALWKHRNELAHASSVAPGVKQITINAPSWSINQQRVLSKLITKLELELSTAAKPP